VNGNETVVTGHWVVNGPLVLTGGETIRIDVAGVLELGEGASVTGDGRIINQYDLGVSGSDVVISVPMENQYNGTSAFGRLVVDSGAALAFRNVSLENNGGVVYNLGFIAFEGGASAGLASNLVSVNTPYSQANVANEGVMLFESASDTGVTSKFVNTGNVYNDGYMYFLLAEVEDLGNWYASGEHAPLYATVFASSVFKHQDDEGEIVAACAPTLTPKDGGPIPTWAALEVEDGIAVAFFPAEYQFSLSTPTSCSFNGQAQPFLGWGLIQGPLENVVGTMIELDPLTAVIGEYTTRSESAVFIAAYGSLAPQPAKSAQPTLPPTGASRAAVVQPLTGGGVLIGLGVICLVVASRRRESLI
jgi:hypothetical protein